MRRPHTLIPLALLATLSLTWRPTLAEDQTIRVFILVLFHYPADHHAAILR